MLSTAFTVDAMVTGVESIGDGDLFICFGAPSESFWADNQCMRQAPIERALVFSSG